MASYKLTYFDVYGLAEPIRYLFSYGKIKFEDIRIQFEEWPELKSTMPFGQMPILDIDGKQVHQSIAISRYLGRKLRLAGDNDWESLQIDIVVETINDIRQKVTQWYWEADEALKVKKYETLTKESIPYHFSRLDTIAKENKGYLANGKFSWADIYLTAILDYMNAAVKFDIIEKYPNLRKVKENVVKLPEIQKWIVNRKKTDL